MPEGTLKALADHSIVRATMPADGGDCEEYTGAVRQGEHRRASAVGRASSEGAKSFVNSWNDLMATISSKCAVLDRSS
jgi:transaldolase